MASCSDLLKGGIFDIVKIKSAKSLSTNYNDWVETATRQQVQEAVAAGLDVVIPVDGVPIPLGLNFSDQDWALFESSRKAGKVVVKSESQAFEMFSKVADATVVNAYVKCLEGQNRKQGLQISELTANQSRDYATLTVTWVPQPGNGDAKIGKPQLTNLVLDGEIPSKFIANKETILKFRIPDSKRDCVAVIPTNKGDILALNPYAPPPPKIRVFTVQLLNLRANRPATIGGPVTLKVNGKTVAKDILMFDTQGPVVDVSLFDLKIDVDETDVSRTIDITCEMDLGKPGLGRHHFNLISTSFNKADFKDDSFKPFNSPNGWSYVFEGMSDSTYGSIDGRVIPGFRF